MNNSLAIHKTNNSNISPSCFVGSGLSDRDLWKLLERGVLLFTGGGSSSIPCELAEELLRSILYTLQQGYLAEGDLSSLPAEEQLVMAQRHLYRQTEKAKSLIRILPRETIFADNIYFRQTIQELEDWLPKYAIRFFAHRPPAGIDYQLVLPLSEDLQGINYALAYLHGLWWETKLTACFATPKLYRLLKAWLPEWPDLCVNLCEPVLCSALGRVIAGAAPQPLLITGCQQKIVKEKLQGLSVCQLEKHLKTAMIQLFNELELWQEEMRGYFFALLPELVPRIASADTTGFEKIFIALEEPPDG